MAINLALRKDPTWRIICTCPDICKTPVGGTPVPVPYLVCSMLSTTKKEQRNVRFNGKKAFNFESITSRTLGDQPGILKGLKSQTTGGDCFPIQKSSSFSIGKHKVVRAYDPFWMNAKGKNGNTVGFVIQIPPVNTSVDVPDKPDPVWPDVLESLADLAEIAVDIANGSFTDASQAAASNSPFA